MHRSADGAFFRMLASFSSPPGDSYCYPTETNLMTIDILVAPKHRFDEILQDIHNTSGEVVSQDAGLSIDDVVTITAIYRNAIDDRAAWWKIRREVNARFATHPDIQTRTLAAIPGNVIGEIAGFSSENIGAIAERWIAEDGATPRTSQNAMDSLASLVAACNIATTQSTEVLLRTNQPPNAFERAFSTLGGKELANYQKAFGKWDDTKRHEAHQKYNYYQKQGLANCLTLVLRDLTRPKTKKVNLKTDQRTIQRHIAKRVKAYRKNPCPILGSPGDPVKLITLTFDIEYEGYVDFDFDTRPDAISDIRWEERTEECLEIPHWNEGMQRFCYDEIPLNVTLHDGSKTKITSEAGEDVYERYIGDMLRDSLIDARESGLFDILPLARECFMLVAGTHANYAWPDERGFCDAHSAHRHDGG